MAKRQSKIRWRDSDHAELQRVINNFNAKLYRLKKNHPEMEDYLPNRVKKADIIKSVGTRADLNKQINSLKRFSRKGAEKPRHSSRGAKSTEWEVNEYKIKQRMENARRARERKRLGEQDVRLKGKSTGVKRAEMGSIKENAVKPSKAKFESKSQKEWDLFKENMDRNLNEGFSEFKKHNMRLNYIKGLRSAGFSEDIVDLVLKTDIDVFVDYVDLDEYATFDFIYDPIEFQLHQEALRETWEYASQMVTSFQNDNNKFANSTIRGEITKRKRG